MSVSNERKFLHDLATPLSISKVVLNSITKELQNKPLNDDSLVKIQKWMEKAKAAIVKMEDLHAQHKEDLFKEEAA